MTTKAPSSLFPFLRSCTEECNTPLEGETKGEIPKWLKGNLVRVGSGLLKVGPDHYNHIFDGLALMHGFSFQDGKVTYKSRFLRSDTYRRNMKANRILVGEFGTPPVPDPCKTIFQRFSSVFSPKDFTDNDLVNIVLFSDEAYACSETNCIWKIDPQTLESIEKVRLNKFVPVNAAVAHTHEGTDGTVYNVGSTYGFNSYYHIIKFPPKADENDNPFQRGSVICKIPSSKFFSISYHHSFGMTENYFVFVEQPLNLSISQMTRSLFFGGISFADALHWDGNRPARFHVVRRSDGHLLETVYIAKSFFVFHHINAYEEDNHLVIDMCTYDSGDIVKNLYVKALEELFSNPKSPSTALSSKASRYVLPLISNNIKYAIDENLVKLPNCNATAKQLEDGSIFCSPECLTESESWSPELPRINYEKFNGKNYKYFYAMARKDDVGRTHLIKVDTKSKETTSWSEEGVIPSEPVFIADPDDQSGDEDSGVLLASLLYTEDETKVSMLVLNAKTMEERGRVNFMTKSSVPGDFHGTFISNA